MLGTTIYQAWAGSLNTFVKDIVCPNLTVTGNSTVSGNTILNNLTVNGTITGITKLK